MSLKTHTHLAETKDEENLPSETGVRPFKLMEKLGWMDEKFILCPLCTMSPEVVEMGRVKGGVAHCPSSNMRLASGITPITMLKAGVLLVLQSMEAQQRLLI